MSANFTSTSMARVLLVLSHSYGGATERLRDAAVRGAADAGTGIEVVPLDVTEAGADDVRGAAGLLLCTPARFGALAGLVKDFFERVYPWFEEVPDLHPGLPYALVVR